MTTTVGLALLVIGVTMAMPGPARAQAASSYTMEQAKDGEKAYNAACVGCHSVDLGGSEKAPVLAGRTFAARWDGRSVGELTRFLRDHMPQTFPGLLNDRTYLALVAYLLAKNGVSAGQAPLTLESGWTIRTGSR